MKNQISTKKLKNYRAGTFRTSPGKQITTKEGALEFVEQRGFVYFWPIKDILMPSLWVAVAGDRPVADAHDDPGHVTWGWKDSLLGARRWYYAKVLRKKATMISLEYAPYFYALTENYGSPEEDYLIQYMQGEMTQEAKTVYEALLFDGPMDTIALRRAARLTSKESSSRFNRALVDLQSDFKILPVGVSQSGGWRYSFIYDLVPRHYPDLPNQAQSIRESEARRKLVYAYLRSVGAAQFRDISKLFRWSKKHVEESLNALGDSKDIFADLEIGKQPGTWFAIPELI